MNSPNLVSVREADLDTALAVHVQIPEFDPDYIAKNIDRIDPLNKHPYIVVAEVDRTNAGYLIAYEKPDDSRAMHIWLNGVAIPYRERGVFGAMLGALAAFGFDRTITDGNSVRLSRDLL